MIFIGDVHANWKEYKEICLQYDQTLQLGDFGLGFMGRTDPLPEELPNPVNHKFIRGNHDNPAVCRAHANHLSDWGFNSEMDLFWVAGGFSIDYEYRVEGVDWWGDEELSYQELSRDVLPSFITSKPRIMVSHECPVEAQFAMFPQTRKRLIQNRTKMALQSMWDAHKPDMWVFGHYHEKQSKSIGGTQFVCCPDLIRHRPLRIQKEYVTFEIPELSWS